MFDLDRNEENLANDNACLRRMIFSRIIIFRNTVRCRWNEVNFLEHPNNRQIIKRCGVLESLQYCLEYDIMDNVTRAYNFITQVRKVCILHKWGYTIEWNLMDGRVIARYAIRIIPDEVHVLQEQAAVNACNWMSIKYVLW